LLDQIDHWTCSTKKENLFACGRTLRRQESNPHEVSAPLDSKKVLGV
jgi:hypothetical protein